MKLKSGLEVTLRPVTFSERQEARNAVQVGQDTNGSMIIQNSTKSQELWVRAGLENVKGIKFETFKEDKRLYATDETLMRLSDNDMVEISLLVRNENTQGDYEKKE